MYSVESCPRQYVASSLVNQIGYSGERVTGNKLAIIAQSPADYSLLVDGMEAQFFPFDLALRKPGTRGHKEETRE